MLGLPTETVEQSEATSALRSKDRLRDFGLTEPYPGTELWIDAQKYGHLMRPRYKNNLLSEHSGLIPRPEPRSSKSIERAWKFYFRPGQSA